MSDIEYVKRQSETKQEQRLTKATAQDAARSTSLALGAQINSRSLAQRDRKRQHSAWERTTGPKKKKVSERNKKREGGGHPGIIGAQDQVQGFIHVREI